MYKWILLNFLVDVECIIYQEVVISVMKFYFFLDRNWFKFDLHLEWKKKILFVVRGISFFFKLILARRTILCSIIYPTILYFSNFAKILSKIDIFFSGMTKLDSISGSISGLPHSAQLTKEKKKKWNRFKIRLEWERKERTKNFFIIHPIIKGGGEGEWTKGEPIAVFPGFIMQFLINLCGRDKYSGVTAILIDITKEYSWGKLEGRSIYASRTFSNFCSSCEMRGGCASILTRKFVCVCVCVEISWNTRRQQLCPDSIRAGFCAPNDKPTHS